MHTPRPVRVSTPDIEVRLGGEFGRLLDISATGALVRVNAPVPVRSKWSMVSQAPLGSCTTWWTRLCQLPSLSVHTKSAGMRPTGHRILKDLVSLNLG